MHIHLLLNCFVLTLVSKPYIFAQDVSFSYENGKDVVKNKIIKLVGKNRDVVSSAASTCKAKDQANFEMIDFKQDDAIVLCRLKRRRNGDKIEMSFKHSQCKNGFYFEGLFQGGYSRCNNISIAYFHDMRLLEFIDPDLFVGDINFGQRHFAINASQLVIKGLDSLKALTVPDLQVDGGWYILKENKMLQQIMEERPLNFRGFVYTDTSDSSNLPNHPKLHIRQLTASALPNPNRQVRNFFMVDTNANEVEIQMPKMQRLPKGTNAAWEIAFSYRGNILNMMCTLKRLIH